MARERSAVRSVVVGVVALVIGLGLGGVGPRGELRSLQQQLEEAREQCDRGAIGREVARVFTDRPWQRGDDEAAPVAPPEPVAEPEPPHRIADDGPVRIEIDGEERVLDGDDPGETLAVARDAMALRQRQAYAALEEQARPDAAQMATIEATIDDMNAELRYLTESFVDTVRAGEPTRRDALVFAADTLDVLIEADDRLYGALDEAQRAEVDDAALDPMSYVDPALIDILSSLEGAP